MSRPARRVIASAALDLLDKGRSVNKVADELAEYLIEERRTRELAGLIRDIEQLRFARHGILEAEAISARSLGESTRAKLSKLLSNKPTVLDSELEADLIGGVKVVVLDRQLDLSIRSKLNQLKHMSVTSS